MAGPIDVASALPRAPLELRNRAVTSRINLTWLLWLRWGAAAGQLAIIAFASLWLGVELALAPLLTLVGIGVASNVACG